MLDIFKEIVYYFINTQNFILLLPLVFILLSKNIYRIIFFLITLLILLISVTYFQQIFWKNFIFCKSDFIDQKISYDVVILGGNDVKRIPHANYIDKNYNINKILLIRDSNSKNFVKYFYSILDSNKLFLSRISKNTYEDILIISSSKFLSQNLIIITDDFQVLRVKNLVKNSNKNLYFHCVENNFNFTHFINLKNGIKLYSLFISEKLKSLYLYIFLK